MTTPASGVTTERRPDWAALAIAGFLLGVAAVVYWDMGRLPPPGRYDPLGPTGFPYLVAGGLVILAIGTAYNAVRGNFPVREQHDLLPVLIVVGGVLAQIGLLRIAGFTIATGILFAATAFAFRERRLYLSVPFGLILAGVVWFVFARLLQLTLPEGPPERFVIETLASLSGAG